MACAEQHEGWYCQSDEAFLTDMQVKTRQAWLAEQQGHELSSSSSESECEQDEDMVSSESGHPVVRLTEENYMFDLSNFQAKLLDWVQTQPGAVEPVSAKNEVRRSLFCIFGRAARVRQQPTLTAPCECFALDQTNNNNNNHRWCT